ncbi:MAG: CYTH domain-containing protein [Verrucomicrobiota bacterium]
MAFDVHLQKMPSEIERRFLVDGDFPTGPAHEITQGFLSTDPDRTVRVRVAGEKAWLTIKARGEGIARHEFEYEIPVTEAQEMLKFSVGTDVSKIRTVVRVGEHEWEVDKFLGANEGLIVAEVELEHVGEEFEVPAWVGEEITTDSRFTNAMLANSPYSTWETKL